MRTLEHIVTEIMTLSKEAMISSLVWEDILNHCERYLRLIGVANVNKFKADLNSKLCDIKSKNFDHYLHRLQKLVDELSNHG